MTDCQFPLIHYKFPHHFQENGESHGEQFREQIKDLFEIRKNLLLEKNPSIKTKLDELAFIQFDESKKYSNDIATELEGIANGSNLRIQDIVLLNNYTDFRDITLPNEGCSTIQSVSETDSVCGQTWDMHQSAKNYVSVIKIDSYEDQPAQLIFSLVGCVGMMGFNSNNLMIGVNNLNTKNAKASIIWPLLIRKALLSKSYQQLETTISNAPVTSGHNYQISSPTQGSQWEVTPLEKDRVLDISTDGPTIFHTNHCLGENTTKQEDNISSNSTTHNRFVILEKLNGTVLDYDQAFDILTGHEGYPKSICSHFESNSQDPSTTCGGALGSFKHNKFRFWRGCKKYDQNYIAYNFKLGEDKRSFNLV